MVNCYGKFLAVVVANNAMNTLLQYGMRNNRDEVGLVGCQIFGTYKKHHGSKVKEASSVQETKSNMTIGSCIAHR